VPAVRARMVAIQREIARNQSLVMDGRDIGTKVLPGATVKIFLTASAQVRARRRFDELREKGLTPDFDTVLADIVERDRQDTTRAASPLMRAEDAVEIDTSEMALGDVIDRIIAIAREAL
jgi:cytidylate kinase